MPGKIFINYRREDDPSSAARLRDGLSKRFGKRNVFMDVANLLPGQRFEHELGKALANCDVLIAVIGPRWMELLSAKQATEQRDYVRKEVAAALHRGIVVIPVRIGHQGDLRPLPKASELPDDIRDLVAYQQHDITYGHFERDISELCAAITSVLNPAGHRPVRAWGQIAGMAAIALAFLYMGVSLPWSTWLDKVRLAAPDANDSIQEINSSILRQGSENCQPGEIEIGLTRRSERHCVRIGAGRTKWFRDCELCPEMVVVPAGEFAMGDRDGPDEQRPLHTVTIAKPFAVGRYEVTFAEWDACAEDGGCTHRPKDEGRGRGQFPVVDVSWNHITKEYLPWLSKSTGKPYRLLTEAEWEYAARAGTRSLYSWGDGAERNKANCDGCGSKWSKQAAPVGSFMANGLGLFDVHGNVWELVQDCWNKNYQGAPANGSAWLVGDCTRRVIRGGSWYAGPKYMGSAFRDSDPVGYKNSNVGFRVGRTLN